MSEVMLHYIITHLSLVRCQPEQVTEQLEWEEGSAALAALSVSDLVSSWEFPNSGLRVTSASPELQPPWARQGGRAGHSLLEWQDHDIWWLVLCINFNFWYFAMKQLPQILVITVKESINREITSARPIKCTWMSQFLKYEVISYPGSQLSAHCHPAASSQVLHCPRVSPSSAGCWLPTDTESCVGFTCGGSSH